jgi:hypothetical protein
VGGWKWMDMVMDSGRVFWIGIFGWKFLRDRRTLPCQNLKFYENINPKSPYLNINFQLTILPCLSKISIQNPRKSHFSISVIQTSNFKYFHSKYFPKKTIPNKIPINYSKHSSKI